MNEDKILYCLLCHLQNLDETEKEIIIKLKDKVVFSQIEIDLCLQLGYLRKEMVSEPNLKGGLYSYQRDTTTPKGETHIKNLWSVSLYNRKWYRRVFQFSWSNFWTVVLTSFLSVLFTYLFGCCLR